LLFLIDAQLPPSLAEALRQTGCQAVHVADIDMLTATDRQIWDEAVSRSAVLSPRIEIFHFSARQVALAPSSSGFELATSTTEP
jgi:predicted nuclease of predicted toxin-antitoxin system